MLVTFKVYDAADASFSFSQDFTSTRRLPRRIPGRCQRDLCSAMRRNPGQTHGIGFIVGPPQKQTPERIKDALPEG